MKKKTWVATLSVDRTAHESRLPEAAIGMEDGADSSRTAERASGNPAGTPEYDLRSDSGEKCFAEIRGSDKPDEWILVGAYLDSWDFGTGPQDNGTGSVSVLELARVISEIGKQPQAQHPIRAVGRRRARRPRFLCVFTSTS